MARVMIAVMPFAGHVAPMVAVVREFIARGHDVRVYTGSAHANSFRSVGVTVVPWREAPDFDELSLEATFPQLRGRKGPRQTLANLEHLFIRTGAAQHRDLTREWVAAPWDVLLADSLSCGAALIAETTRAPWATLSLVPLTSPSRDLPPAGLALQPARGPFGRVRDAILRRVFSLLTLGLHRAWNEIRETAGLARTSTRFDRAWFSPTLTCVTGLASLDYPRSDLPTTTHYVGLIRTAPPAAVDHPAWWMDVETATVPVVHVTQGTFNVDPEDLIRPTLTGLADADVLSVVTTGRASQSTLPFPAPRNARIAGILPYDELFPLTSVVITNGGWGGVLLALGAGIPLIVAGGDIDKPEIAARVAYSGAGIDLRTGRPSPKAIAAAYRRIATEDSFRVAAKRIGRELAASKGASDVVDRCERLVG